MRGARLPYNKRAKASSTGSAHVVGGARGGQAPPRLVHVGRISAGTHGDIRQLTSRADRDSRCLNLYLAACTRLLPAARRGVLSAGCGGRRGDGGMSPSALGACWLCPPAWRDGGWGRGTLLFGDQTRWHFPASFVRECARPERKGERTEGTARPVRGEKNSLDACAAPIRAQVCRPMRGHDRRWPVPFCPCVVG